LPGYRHVDADIRDEDAMRQVFATYKRDVAVVIHTAEQPSHDWAARDHRFHCQCQRDIEFAADDEAIFLPRSLIRASRHGGCSSPTAARAMRRWRSFQPARDPGTVRDGPRQGFVTNVLSLACDPSRASIIMPFAIRTTSGNPASLRVQRLSSRPVHIPAMCCSRTILIDDEGGTLGYSRAYRRKPSFRNVLVQSIASGNTIVFNEATRRLICGGGVKVPSHIIS
jgi:hypothetical protein